jgi:hypothetical protein
MAQILRGALACAPIPVLALAFAAPAAARAEEGGAGRASAAPAPSDAEAGLPAVSSRPPLYQLPKVGKPRGRIGGGRRGPIEGVAELHALAPDHVGQTTSAQPILYWYLAEPAAEGVAFEITLIDATSIDPLLDRRLARPGQTGLQRVALSELGISLEPGQEYQWSIAAVPDPEDHAKDVVASGWIERVPAPDDIEARLAAAGPGGAAAVYGAEGLWYDMLDAAFERVRANPDALAYREDLLRVLEQAGLPGEAARR